MKFSKTSQLALVSAIGLAAASLLAGCQLVTIDYVFVACSAGTSAGSAGQIETYAADSESGALRLVDKPVSSGGTNPVAMATTSNFFSLYVANQGNSTVVHFGIADTGVLSPLDTLNTAQPPVSLAVNQADTYLYVITGTTSATLTEYPLDPKAGKIGAATAQVTLSLPGNPADTIIPTGVTVLANNNAVYVSAYDQSAYNPGGAVTSTANPGWVFGFTVGSGGALTATASSPYKAGVKPSAITADPTSRFLYVTDFASNQIVGYQIQTNGTLNFMLNGPFKTGNEPVSVAVDARGIYIYLANSLDNTVSAYTISLPTGTPSAVVNTTSSALYSTDTQPVSLAIDPALGRFVYTANYLGNSISGFRLDPNSGALTTTQATPYPTGAKPTAVAIVPHGNHATQSVTP